MKVLLLYRCFLFFYDLKERAYGKEQNGPFDARGDRPYVIARINSLKPTRYASRLLKKPRNRMDVSTIKRTAHPFMKRCSR